MVEPSGPRAGGRPILSIVVALVVVVAVVVFVVRAGSADRAGPPSPELTTVDVVVIPVGATLVRADDGGVLGQAPLTLSLVKSDTDLPVIVKAPGYQDRLVKVPLFSETGRVDVTLIAIGADAAAPPRPTPDGWNP
jgi:hypothetical protein